ncbi:MAG TPA: sucrase ferredoxin [Acidimicrobiales bacterium]|nr:sucrase ferredoxin [Acidimicrobiales bacterium]
MPTTSRSVNFAMCSEWSRSQGLHPVGTAGHYNGFLLVEQPLPWPSDVASIDVLRPLSDLCAQHNYRLQAVVRPGGNQGGQRRLISYRRAGTGWAAPLLRTEVVVGEADLESATRALLEESPAAQQTVPSAAGSAGGPSASGSAGGRPPAVLDLLVCTHGRRDACCGSRGAELYLAVGERPGVAVWRTSHTGGHRFAPTLVALPEASLWAYADVELVEALLGRRPWAPAFWDRYRGCALVGGGPEQALEAAVAVEVGRGLLADRRRVEGDGGGPRLRLVSGLSGTWEADVVPGRRVAQPDCRTDPTTARKASTEWVVRDLRQVGSA